VRVVFQGPCPPIPGLEHNLYLHYSLRDFDLVDVKTGQKCSQQCLEVPDIENHRLSYSNK
jgi:hypothetical protein